MTLAEPPLEKTQDLRSAAPSLAEAPRLLEVRDLRVGFETADGDKIIVAVDGVSFSVPEGGTLGLVGESGSGKSVTCLSVLKLLAERGRILGGEVLFGGRDLMTLGQDEMQALRGDEIAMIFQDPMSSLNPVKRVGWQIAEALVIHENLNNKAAEDKAIELLAAVGIPEPKMRARAFPHQLSGGMCQRVMIAMALACKPKLLIADEPTTALDVTIQAQILRLLRQLADDTGTAVVLITHDLGVVAEVADEVAVMYAGRVVETAPVAEIFADPKHPYTMGLLGSLPSRSTRRARLPMIKGTVPAPEQYPAGCRFAPRCPRASGLCSREKPQISQYLDLRFACHHPIGMGQ
ncbi:MAG: ABC transporter ATP-binding protein [Pseudomonadota bacterium]